MAEKDTANLDKARVFFDRARKIASTNNFDYAIDMYLEGLNCAPESVQEGHIPLRELALLRQVKGGKKPPMMERVKKLRGKTPLERMLGAEYLFAKDPDHLPYGEAMLKAAAAGGYKQTGKWIADLIFQANNAAERPSFNTYILLKDSYLTIGEIERALAACERATKVKPSDATLANEFQTLSAELTVSRGKYDQEGDFRKSIKNREEQELLQSQDAVVKTVDYRVKAVKNARKALAEEPNLPRNIFNLAEALSDLQIDDGDKEAIKLLEIAYKTKNDFSFKQRAGLIKIKHIKRKIRQAKSALEANPNDEHARSEVAKLAENLKDTELEHYRLCTENYPTDLQLKYEYGTRLILNNRSDDAIPLFQAAQRDPRLKIAAMNKIGLCFFTKGWFSDAIDIFNQAMDSHETKDDGIGKELRYNMARACEENGDTQKAVDIYRKIAQLDFGYRDVRQRVDNLRKKDNNTPT